MTMTNWSATVSRSAMVVVAVFALVSAAALAQGLTEEHRVNIGIDYAGGQDEGVWYFRIGEAF